MRIIIARYIIVLLGTAIAASSCDNTKLQPNTLKLSNEKTEVRILSLLTFSEKEQDCQLTFGAVADTTLQLAMLVGNYEAQMLTIAIKEIKPKAPLPLDVLQEAIIKFGYTVKESVVDGVSEDIYTAKIICGKENDTVEFIARPVDAAAIALKFNAPIFVRTDLLKR